MTRTKPIDDAPRQSSSVSSPASEPATAPPRPEIRFVPRPWLLALVLVVVTFVAYQPVWRAGFIWDDDAHLTANWAMTAPHGLKMIWSSLAVGRYYPLTLTTFWFQRRLWGLHPLPYHLVNVLLHAANGVLLFYLLRRLRIPAAWLAAMVWTLHPVNVESVAWISELKNTQSALFFFLSLLFFLKFDEEKRLSHRWYRGYLSASWYVLAFGCGSAAILSNASTAVLPLALLLAVWWQRGHWERADAVRIAPYVGMAWLVSGLVILEQYSQVAKAAATGWRLGGPADRFVVAGKAIWFYAAKVLWPFRLAFVYPQWAIHASSWWSWVPIAALVALTVALWRCRSRAGCRAVLFAGGFFVGALLPVLGFFSLYYFRFSYVADRFQYLASVGIIALVCGGAATYRRRALSSADLPSIALAKERDLPEGQPVRHRLGEGGYVAAAALALLLAVLGTLTWRQARIYQNSDTLWRDAIAKNPRSWLAHTNLGYFLWREGKLSDAIGHYEQALQIKPDYVEGHLNMGNLLLQEGKISDAIGRYEQALRIKPDYAEGHYALAIALARTGKTDDAIAHFEQALQIRPDYAEAHYALALALAQTGKTDDAIAHYGQALQMKPDYAQAHYALATVLAQTGKTDDAIAHDEQALRIKPDYAEAHWSLGDLFFLREGKVSDAIGHYEQALQIKPDLNQVHYNLALALEQAGRIEEAIAHYEQDLRIQPDHIEAYCNLGSLFLHEGKTSDAIGQYEQALRIKPEYAEAHYGLALALEHARRTDDAIAHFEQALQIRPDYAEAHCNLGDLLWHEGKINDAIAQYEEALLVKPEYPEAHYGLALVLEHAGRIDEAFAHFEQALWIKPDYTEAQTALVRLQARQ